MSRTILMEERDLFNSIHGIVDYRNNIPNYIVITISKLNTGGDVLSTESTIIKPKEVKQFLEYLENDIPVHSKEESESISSYHRFKDLYIKHYAHTLFLRSDSGKVWFLNKEQEHTLKTWLQMLAAGLIDDYRESGR